MKNILVTGAAGFIGANLVMRLLRDMKEGTIIGLDNLNNYFDPSLKEYRLREIDTYYAQLTNSQLTLNSKPSTLNYQGVQHLIYASSSVYGGNKKVPFSVDDRVAPPRLALCSYQEERRTLCPLL